MSFTRLQKKIDELNNPTVVGLDPDLRHIPPEILEKHIADRGETPEAAALAIIEFNKGLIDVLCDVVPAVKPQSAYYEMFGSYGVFALQATCKYAKSKGMYVIVDGKRNDIGSTASAYSAAYLGGVNIGNTECTVFDSDALTVNAYLGSDGLTPFVDTAKKYDKAVFALVRTSNPSAGELQDLTVSAKNGNLSENSELEETEKVQSNSAEKLFVKVGELLERLAADSVDGYGYSHVGAVVGATYPEEMQFLRKHLKHTFFLVPGYGAQGGSASDVAYAFDENGRGAVVNSSRAIIAAWKKRGGDYAAAALDEALSMREELRRVR